MRTLALTLLMLTLCGVGWAGEAVLQTISMEAADQGAYGQYLVASVIVNRAKERGQTLDRVCLAKKQFSCWNSPKWAKAWLDTYFGEKQRGGARNALKRAIMSPYQGVDHYHTKSIKPYWAKGQTPTLTYGEHVFYDLEG